MDYNLLHAISKLYLETPILHTASIAYTVAQIIDQFAAIYVTGLRGQLDTLHGFVSMGSYPGTTNTMSNGTANTVANGIADIVTHGTADTVTMLQRLQPPKMSPGRQTQKSEVNEADSGKNEELLAQILRSTPRIPDLNFEAE